jgi:hypothetical protein
MAKRGRKGGLQRNLNDDEPPGNNNSRAPKSSRSVNQGRGQEITGVTLPAAGTLKGWEFGDGVQMACANVGGTFFAIQVSLPMLLLCSAFAATAVVVVYCVWQGAHVLTQ